MQFLHVFDSKTLRQDPTGRYVLFMGWHSCNLRACRKVDWFDMLSILKGLNMFFLDIQ